MAGLVTKILRDGDRRKFAATFWEDDEGNLTAVNKIVEPIQLSGRSAIEIGGATFYAEGGTIYDLTASLPAAADAHAVLPFGFYYAVDTGVLYGNTGTAWVAQ